MFYNYAQIAYTGYMFRYLFYPPPPDITLRTRWYVAIRWLTITAVAVPGIVLHYRMEAFSGHVLLLVIIACVAFLTNGGFFILTRLPKDKTFFSRLAGVIIASDLLFISMALLISGGFLISGAVLFVLPVLVNLALFGRRHLFKSILAAIVLYNTSIVINHFSPLLHQQGQYELLSNMILVSSALIIVGVMINVLMKALKEQEYFAIGTAEGLKLAQSIAGLGIWEWEIQSDDMTWSDQLYNIFGTTKGLINPSYESLLSFYIEEDRPRIRKEIKKALAGKRIFSFEGRIDDENGGFRYIHTDGQALKDKEGNVIKLFGTSRDVTDAKLLEEARSDFVSLASHQLRTPATGVKQYIKMLQDGYAGSLTPAQDRLLRTAYDSNERQLGVVDDLLHVAQIDSGKVTLKKSPTDIITLLNDIVREQEIEFRTKQQRVTIRTRNKKLVCVIDEQRLRMALENIIDNARKYTPIGKDIEIRVRRIDGFLKIEIADQGMGIAKEDITRLFQKFTRIEGKLTSMVGGTGLGLYWAKRIITLHKGTISVDSKVGKGTTFIVTLPTGQRKQSR